MTSPVGGYRRPENPAPVSGPGALSRRTDGGPGDQQPIRELPDAKYGEAADFRAQQQGAPLARTEQPGPRPGPPAQPGVPATREVVPFAAPSQRPGEPVTAGAPVGPGRAGDFTMPGQVQAQPGQLSAALAQHFAEDPTGIIRLLAEELAERGV